MKIHARAKLTPLLRKEIHYSKERISVLAKKYNVNENTIRKWKRRTDFEDRSSRRKKICFTLNEFEEALICEVKKLTLFSIYDLLNILKPYIPQLNKDNLYRCLKRNGLNRNDLIIPNEDKKEKHGKFKDYDVGYIHIDVKDLPKINNQKKYLFVAIDRKTRICVIKIYENKDTTAAVDFLQFCVNTFPFRITKVLTDNGQCFTDRFAKGRLSPSGQHPFDVTCKNLNIEHRLTKPYSPHTNGMVERMNARFNDNVLNKFHFISYSHLESNLLKYIYEYNFFLKQKALNFLSPINFLIKYIKTNSDKYKNFNIFASDFMNLFLYNDKRIDT